MEARYEGFVIKSTVENEVEIDVEVLESQKKILVSYRVGASGTEWVDYCIFDRGIDSPDYGVICTITFSYEERGEEEGRVLDAPCSFTVPGHGTSTYPDAYRAMERVAKVFDVANASIVADATEQTIADATGFDTYDMFAGKY